MSDPIIEAAEQALEACWNNNRPTGAEPFPLSTGEALQAIVAAVTPLIRAAALEEAAQTVETMLGRRDAYARDNIAGAIRALKEQA